jgi:hypothetical protein
MIAELGQVSMHRSLQLLHEVWWHWDGAGGAALVRGVTPGFRDKPSSSAGTLSAVEDVEDQPDVRGSLEYLGHFNTTMDIGGRVSRSPQRVTAAPVVDRYPRMPVIWWSALLKTMDFRSVDVL